MPNVSFSDQDSKLRNLEELEAARAKEAWEKHVVSDTLVVVCACAIRAFISVYREIG